MSAYANRIGRTKQHIGQIRQAAEVAQNSKVDFTLLLDRAQDELSPLEIGMHALKAVPKAQGKKGGGLQAYANQLGRSKQQMGEVRQAAEVASTCTDIRTSLLDKAYHLALIHKLPRSCWPGAVEALGNLSVAEVRQCRTSQDENRCHLSIAVFVVRRAHMRA